MIWVCREGLCIISIVTFKFSYLSSTYLKSRLLFVLGIVEATGTWSKFSTSRRQCAVSKKTFIKVPLKFWWSDTAHLMLYASFEEECRLLSPLIILFWFPNKCSVNFNYTWKWIVMPAVIAVKVGCKIDPQYQIIFSFCHTQDRYLV